MCVCVLRVPARACACACVQSDFDECVLTDGVTPPKACLHFLSSSPVMAEYRGQTTFQICSTLQGRSTENEQTPRNLEFSVFPIFHGFS